MTNSDLVLLMKNHIAKKAFPRKNAKNWNTLFKFSMYVKYVFILLANLIFYARDRNCC